MVKFDLVNAIIVRIGCMKTKEVHSNKSGLVEKKSSHLVINTQLENSFDNRWAEIKIEGKNIASRSYHVSLVFGHYLYVHGGYDVEKGLIGDFHEMDLSEDCEEYIWKKLNNTCEGKEIRLKGHSGVTYKERMLLFGGQVQTSLSNNNVYIYDFVTKNWKCVPGKENVPKLDSHCAVVVENKMFVYGGYISDKAEYMKDIYAFNIDTLSWEIVYKGAKGEKEPQGRSNFSMVQHNGNLFIFGGTNGSKTLNDMWKFDLKTKRWEQVESKDTPEPRRGHSMIKYENFVFMFGGIQDVTKEKNDIIIYQFDKSQWFKIHTTTNAVYECSPTLKRDSKKNKSPDNHSPSKISPEKSDRNENPMKKILNENKQKKFMERKRQLLKQFTDKDNEPNKKRELSPTTQSMLKTLETIGNQEASHKELKQEIIYDETHRFIIGKKPCARDGQTVNVYNSKMYIFGGDRHLMAFNDLYQFDLNKGVKSLQIYKSH